MSGKNGKRKIKQLRQEREAKQSTTVASILQGMAKTVTLPLPRKPEELLKRVPPENLPKEFKKHEGETDEQAQIRKASEGAQRLLANPAFMKLFSAMVTMRQMYAVAYRELLEQVEAAGEESTVTDFVVQMNAYQGSKVFSEHDLMQAVVDFTLPWIGDVIDKHAIEDAKEQDKLRKQQEEERLSKPIPLFFRHTEQEPERSLTRSTPLILVGWSPAVTWLCNAIATHIEKDKLISMLFATTNSTAPIEGMHRVRVTSNWWKGCGNGRTAMENFVSKHLAGHRIPDLLIVENLAEAYTAGFIGRSPAANAGDACRAIFAWCKDQGTAMIGAIPCAGEAPPQVTTPDYEQLRTFTLLRVVTVSRKTDTHAYVRIGNCSDEIEIPLNELTTSSFLKFD